MKIKLSKSQWEFIGKIAGWQGDRIRCKVCGQQNSMNGTGFCDKCWAIKRHLENYDKSFIHRYKDNKLVEKIRTMLEKGQI